MRESAHEISQDVWKQWILNAIAKIRSQKQRPSVQRICQAIGTHHKFHEDIVAEKLEEAVESGAVIKVYNKGLHSYKAPMAKRKIIVDKNTNLCKIVARAVHDLGECEGSTLKSIENYIQKFNNIELSSDADFRAVIKSSIKKAVDAGFLIQEGKLYKKGRSLTTPRKSVANTEVPFKVGDENCMHCNGTAQKNQNGVPEPLSSCKQCGISLHTTCANIAAKCKTQSYVLLYMLVTKGSIWYCQNCTQCDTCEDYDKGPCLLQCSICQKKYHLTCLDTPPDKKPKHPYKCKYCIKDNGEISRIVIKKENPRKAAETNKNRRRFSSGSPSPPARSTAGATAAVALSFDSPDTKYTVTNKKIRDRGGGSVSIAKRHANANNDIMLPTTSSSTTITTEQHSENNKYFKQANITLQQQLQKQLSASQNAPRKASKQQRNKTFGNFGQHQEQEQQQQQQQQQSVVPSIKEQASRKRQISELSSSSSSSESEDDDENEKTAKDSEEDEDSSSSGSCSSSTSGSDTSDSSSDSSDVDNEENDDDDDDDEDDDDTDDDDDDDDDDDNNNDNDTNKGNMFSSITTAANVIILLFFLSW